LEGQKHWGPNHSRAYGYGLSSNGKSGTGW